MVAEKYAVQLSAEDRDQLERLIRSGQRSARVINRARILLKTDEGWSASQVAAALDTSPRTVFRIKRRYAEEGLDGVLHDHPQANRFRKLDDKAEAHLIALACSDAPEGRDHWTLQLLADRMVELGLVASLTDETVRLKLKERPQAVAQAAVVHPQGRTESSWRRWRTCWICMPNPTIPSVRWCALTRPPSICWPRSLTNRGSRCPSNRDGPDGKTMNIDVLVSATSS